MMGTMTAQTGLAEGPMSFEQIREMFERIGRKQEETALQMKETDRLIEETALQMKETDKKIGKLSNRFGEVVEYMVVPSLVTKFNELGFIFTKAHRDTEIKDREHGIFTEMDVFLENGDSAMVVETKVKPDTRDIDDHIKRMEKMRVYADLHNDRRKFYGAVAGVVMSDSVKNYALALGFYAIEPSGETFTITAPQGPGAPRAW